MLQASALSFNSPGLMKNIERPCTPMMVSSVMMATKFVRLFLKGLATAIKSKNYIK